MKDICIPIPDFLEKQIAQIEVLVNGKKRRYNYRVESFPWETDDPNLSEDMKGKIRIETLKKNIADYDKDWELMQIFQPGEDSKHIQVLFRKKIDA